MQSQVRDASALTATTGDALYNHTLRTGGKLTPYSRATGASTVKSLTVQKTFVNSENSTNLYLVYPGARVDTMDISYGTEGLVSCNFGIVAADELALSQTATITSVTDAVEGTGGDNVAPFTSYQAFVYLGTAGTVPTGLETPIGFVTAFSFNLSNGIFADNFVTGSRNRANALPGTRAMSGSLGMLFYRADEYNDVRNAGTSPQSMMVEFTRGTWDTARIRLNFPYIKFIGSGGGSPQIGGPTPIGLTVPFTCYEPAASDGSRFSISVRNYDAYI